MHGLRSACHYDLADDYYADAYICPTVQDHRPASIRVHPDAVSGRADTTCMLNTLPQSRPVAAQSYLFLSLPTRIRKAYCRATLHAGGSE